ncbi:MAG TPA: metallophosphoesterase, partial [Acidimicrobiia bacterium]|nr:metallophosphoesterase [Acidimicrobiia bacterium]
MPTLFTFGLPATLSAQTAPPPSADPTVVAAGDIAMCPTTGDEATAGLVDGIPGTVLALGDLAYQDGSKADFDNCYTPSWGRFKDRTRPATGNHEYVQKGAGPYFDYFGPAAGDRTKGYYSFDIGSWHLISLNSTCAAAGGCSKNSPMEQWLRADLAAHPAKCTIAYWHHPRFFTPARQPGVAKIEPVDKKMSAFWADLVAAGVDIVLNGHRHDYERFARQDADGNASPTGIREFIVGTGGGPHDHFEGAVAPNSEIRKQDTWGVLQLTLHPESYDWKFVATPGDPFTDSGSEP